LNNIHSMEVHPMGSDSHINIHFIRWMKSIHHGCRLILHQRLPFVMTKIVLVTIYFEWKSSTSHSA
jgi:hypothetical protein